MHIYFRFKKYIIYDSILSRMINTTPKYNYNIYMCIYIYIHILYDINVHVLLIYQGLHHTVACLQN